MSFVHFTYPLILSGPSFVPKKRRLPSTALTHFSTVCGISKEISEIVQSSVLFTVPLTGVPRGGIPYRTSPSHHCPYAWSEYSEVVQVEKYCAMGCHAL